MSPGAEPRSGPQATVQAIWRTRPSRRESDRKLAGVAGAIARRYDIDPTLIRISFVVAAFCGFGIALYLAAWAVLPSDPHQPPKGPLPGRNSRISVHPVVVVVAAVIAGILTLGSMRHGDPHILFGLVVTAGLLYLLHESRGERGLRLARESGGPAKEQGGGPAGTDGGSGPGTTTAASQHQEPPAWDPLGAAPFAWGLPEPAPTPVPPADQPWRRAVLTWVTIAIALLAGGITAAITIAGEDQDAVRLVAGVMLTVIALGLLVGAFLHRGRALLLFAVPLLVVSYLATKVGPVDWRQSGDLRVTPTSVSQLASVYRRDLGGVTLDLRNLDLSTPAPAPIPAPGTPSALGAAPRPNTPRPNTAVPPPSVAAPAPPPAGPPPVRTKIVLRVGRVTVLLPPNADVRLHCHADVGKVRCLNQRSKPGPSADVQINDLGLDHQPGGRPLDIDITVGTGDVQVNRG